MGSIYQLMTDTNFIYIHYNLNFFLPILIATFFLIVCEYFFHISLFDKRKHIVCMYLHQLINNHFLIIGFDFVRNNPSQFYFSSNITNSFPPSPLLPHVNFLERTRDNVTMYDHWRSEYFLFTMDYFFHVVNGLPYK